MHFLSVSLSQGNLVLASVLKAGHLIDITISVCYSNSRLVKILHNLFFSEVISLNYLTSSHSLVLSAAVQEGFFHISCFLYANKS